MNQAASTQSLPVNHRQRERRLVAALRRRGVLVTAGWLHDGKRNKQYRHGRIVEKVRTA